MGFKEKIEELKKDKKKLYILIGGVFLFLVTIILGVVNYMSSDEPLGENRSQVSSIDIPVDSVGINDQSKVVKRNNYSDDFFSIENDEELGSEVVTEENISKMSPVKNSTSYKSTAYKPTYAGGSNTQSYSNNSKLQEKEVDAKAETVKDNKRRRTPTDESGNMVNNSGNKNTMYRGVVANENRLVKSGSYIKIRVAEDIKLGDVLVPRNSVVTGIAKHQGERTIITITSIRIGSTTKSVNWTVYDEDGNIGLPIPASIMNEIAESSTQEAIEDGGTKIEGNVPVVGNVKIKLKKKVGEVEYVIPNGHRLYIKEAK